MRGRSLIHERGTPTPICKSQVFGDGAQEASEARMLRTVLRRGHVALRLPVTCIAVCQIGRLFEGSLRPQDWHPANSPEARDASRKLGSLRYSRVQRKRSRTKRG